MAQEIIRSRRPLPTQKCNHAAELFRLSQENHELRAKLKHYQQQPSLDNLQEALVKERLETARQRREITKLKQQVEDWKEHYRMKYRRPDGSGRKDRPSPVPVLEDIDDLD